MAKTKKVAKTPPLEQKKYNIICDTREQTPFTFNASDWCCGTITTKLDAGDYSLEGFENIFAVERKKSTSEIANNIFEARFPDALARLNAIPHAFVVCEFSWGDIEKFPEGSGIPRSKWNYLRVYPDTIKKKLTEYFLCYSNIHWLFFNGRESAQQFTRQLFKRIIENAKK